MRWLFLVAVVVIMSSCNVFKPVSGTQGTAVARDRNNSPQYIENITLNSGERTGQNSSAANYNHPGDKTGLSSSKSAGTIEHSTSEQFKYAILMDIPVEQITISPLFKFIDEWYGTRYRFGGNTKEGVDCSGFACNLMTTVFGIVLPRIAKEQYHACQRIKRDDLATGDLVFFHTTRKGVSHVGIYLGNNKFVHASTNYGVTISDMSDGYYANRFVGAGRVKSAATVSN